MRFVFLALPVLCLAACSGGTQPVQVTMPSVAVTGPDGVTGTVSTSPATGTTVSVGAPTGPIGVAPGVAVTPSGPITITVPPPAH